MKKLLPVLLGAVLVCILGGCSVLARGPQSSPEKLMEAYLEAFQRGDFDAMIFLSARAEDNAEEQAHLENFIRMIEVVDYSIQQVEYISESEADVRINLTLSLLGHEKTEVDSVRVVRQEGKWFLQGGTPGEL